MEAKLTMAASKSSRTRTSKPAPVRSSPTHQTASPVRVSGTTQRSRNASSSSARSAASSGRSTTAQPATSAGGPPERTTLAPNWLQWTTFVLALVALAASSYLTYQHFTAGKSFFGCADKGFINCDAVTTSAQSHFLGMPVALLGLLFYVFMVAVLSPWAWRLTGESLVARWLPKVRLAAICVGIGMVLYLLYAELFMIRNLCLYCTSVHVVTFLLFMLILFAAGMWGLNPNREDYDF
jgi:uncharacterized membrane protein